MERR
jgi:hypothetical protein